MRLSRLVIIIFIAAISFVAAQSVERLNPPLSARIKTTIIGNGFSLQIAAPALRRTIASAANSRIIDYYDYTDVSAPGLLKIPYEELIIALPPNSKPEFSFLVEKQDLISNAAPAVNPQTSISSDSVISESPVAFSQAKFQPSQPFEVKGYFWYRDFYCAHIRIRLADYDFSANAIEEIVSYRINVASVSSFLPLPIQITNDFDNVLRDVIANSSIAGSFRGTPPAPSADTTASWISYTADYAKIGVGDDRFYRITKQDLEQIGVSTSGLDPRTFQLFSNGKEIPIYVEGESDAVFDTSDYIEFYGTKNYSPVSPRAINPDSMRYNEYLNPFTDTSYYFLTWKQTQGKRIPTMISNMAGVTDTALYYTALIHSEKNTVYQPVSVDVVKNQDPDSLNSKSWFNSFIYVGDSKNDIIISDIVPGKKAAVYSRIISAGSSRAEKAHTIKFGLKIFPTASTDTNLFSVDFRTIDRNTRQVFGGEIPSDSLKAGRNSLVIRNYDNQTVPNYLLLDWCEIEYPRYIIASGDSLYFEFKDTMTTKMRKVYVKSLTSATLGSEYVLYQVKPVFRRITNLTKSGSLLSFADTIATGSAYYLQRKTLVQKVPYLKFKRFVNLRSAARKADYIAITNSVLQSKAKEYAGFIKQSYQADTALVLINDIYDEFAYGYPDPSCIRTFLQAANSLWQLPKPSYLCLIGIGCYDYKRNFFANKGYEVNFNLVPGYGEPVSDTWFTMWSQENPVLPQMFVGRIPSKDASQLDAYLTKHRNTINQRFDLWNKRAILFSGGDGSKPQQLLDLKAVNDTIVSRFAGKPPLSLNYDHFYKTSNPVTDFGPVEPNQVRAAIEKGGLFISYIGHSGTRTWDNSISDPNQLLNKVNKNPVVSDFGCSTNKFAEPDVEAFGAMFVNQGQTIAYVGNSSLGFTSTTMTVPIMFYGHLLTDSSSSISAAHLRSKMDMFDQLGSTGTYRIFALTNLLLGDPLARVYVPKKPNLTINVNNIRIENAEPNDQDESVMAAIAYYNIGAVTKDSVTISVTDTRNGEVILNDLIKRKLPDFTDTIFVEIPVNALAGNHHLRVKVNPSNQLDELYYDDNSAELLFNVSSLAVRPLEISPFSASQNPEVIVLNPARQISVGAQQIIVQYDSSSTFASPNSQTVTLDTFFTAVSLPSLPLQKRFYVRSRSNQSDTLWSGVTNVYRSAQSYSYLLEDKLSFDAQTKQSLVYDNGLKLTKDTIYFSLRSGSGNFSKYGSILKNRINLLDNTFGWGFGLAVIDPYTFRVDTARTMNIGFGEPPADTLAKFINNIPTGKIVCMVVIDDGTGGLNTNLRNAIKTIGSKEIASLAFREPWVIFGKKGAAQGTVPEIRKSATYQDILGFDTVIVGDIVTGYFVTDRLEHISKWNELSIDALIPGDASIVINPLGINEDETVDTLAALAFVNNKASLSALNSTGYKKFQFIIRLNLSSTGQSPVLRTFALQYTGLAELGANYQTVTIPNDTLIVGENAPINVHLKNAGSAAADSFRVYLDVYYPDNTSSRIDSLFIPSLTSRAKYIYSKQYNVPIGPKNRTLKITVDPQNKISEYYKDNNTYTIPFTVITDTTLKPTLTLTSDQMQVFNGDYVADTPHIKIELNDPSLDPITDTTFLALYLDDKHIYYNDPAVKANFHSANPKMEVEYSPKLTSGEHRIEVEALSASRKDTLTLSRTFFVNTNLEAINVYNYPNPFKDQTWFTFHLTQVPDAMQIKIYTIAGRLIKTLNVEQNTLRVGFNKTVVWDGTDDDGALAASGVYLYKCIVSKKGQKSVATQKLAIIR